MYEKGKNIIPFKDNLYDWSKESEPLTTYTDQEIMDAFIQLSKPCRNRKEMLRRKTWKEMAALLTALIIIGSATLGGIYAYSTSDQKAINDLQEQISISSTSDVIEQGSVVLDTELSDLLVQYFDTYHINDALLCTNRIQTYLNKESLTLQEQETLQHLKEELTTEHLENLALCILDYTKDRCFQTLNESDCEQYNTKNYPKIEIYSSFDSGSGMAHTSLYLYSYEESTFPQEMINIKSSEIQDCVNAYLTIYNYVETNGDYDTQEVIDDIHQALATVMVHDSTTLKTKEYSINPEKRGLVKSIDHA